MSQGKDVRRDGGIQEGEVIGDKKVQAPKPKHQRNTKDDPNAKCKVESAKWKMGGPPKGGTPTRGEFRREVSKIRKLYSECRTRGFARLDNRLNFAGDHRGNGSLGVSMDRAIGLIRWVV